MKKRNLLTKVFAFTVAATLVGSTGFANVPFIGSSYVSEVQAAASIRDDFSNQQLYDILKNMAGVTELDAANVLGITGTLDLSKYSFTGADLKGLNHASSLEKVILPATVVDIPAETFKDMSSLTRVDMSKKVTTIGARAFEGCKNLTQIKITEDASSAGIDLKYVTSIGNSAFLNDGAISALTLSSSLKLLDSNAFDSCVNLSSNISLPSGIELGTAVFQGCKALKNVSFPASVKEVPNSFFFGAGTNLGLNVTFASGSQVSRIGYSAFERSAIKSINLDNTKLTTIDKQAFARSEIACDLKFNQLTQLNTIAYGAFFNAGFFYPVVSLPASVTDIGTCAFAGTNISEVSIPDKVTILNKGVFFFDYNLSKVTIGTGSQLQTVDDYAFGMDGLLTSTAFLKNCSKLTRVGSYAFAYCITVSDKDITGGLSEVDLPASVTTIGDHCFYDSACINNVKSLGKATAISEYAFAMENVKTFPNWLSNVKFKAEDSNDEISIDFSEAIKKSYETNSEISYLSAAMNVKLPTTVTAIENNAFEYREKINALGTSTLSAGVVDLSGLGSLSKIGNAAFKDCSYYKSNDTTTENITGLKIVKFPAKLETIGEQAFYHCYNLNDVYFASNSNLTTIGKQAFRDCWPSKVAGDSGLQNLYNFDKQTKLVTIEENAFSGNTCLKLKPSSGSSEFVFPVSLVTIGNNAFSGNATEKIKFMTSLKSIGSSAFENNKNLSSVNFDAAISLEKIGSSAFKGDESLAEADLKKTHVESVESSAFENCVSLERFVGPDEYLKKIGNSVFKGCSALASIQCPVDTVIDNGVFGGTVPGSVTLSVTHGTLSGLNVPFGQKIEFSANIFSSATNLMYSRKSGGITIPLDKDTGDYFKIEHSSGGRFYIIGGADAKFDNTTANIQGKLGCGLSASVDIPISIVGVKAEDVIMLNKDQNNILLDVDTTNTEIAGGYKWVDGKSSTNPTKYVGYVKGNNISTDLDRPTLITLQAKINPSTFTYGSGSQINNLKWEVASGTNVLQIEEAAENVLPTDRSSGATSTGTDSYFTTKQKIIVKNPGVATLRLVYSYKAYNSGTGKWDTKWSCINLVKVNVLNPISRFDMTLKETGKDSSIELIQGGTANILIDKSSIEYADKEMTSNREPQSFVFFSENPEIATVNSNGVVVAQNIYKNGYYEEKNRDTCRITVRTRTGSVSKSFDVKVRPDKDKVVPTYLEIVGDEYLNIGGASKTYTIKNVPALSNENVEWSINGGAATAVQVGNTFKLTPVRTGNVTIKAVSKIGNTNVSKEIKIVSPTKKIKFMKTSGSTEVDSWFSFGFVSDTNAENGLYRPKDNDDFVTFTVADSSIAKISKDQNNANLSSKIVANNGNINIKGLKEGKTTITATTESGGKAVFTISVAKKTIKSIKVKETAKVSAGNTFKLAVTKTPSDSYEGWTFSSTNTAIATVDAKGTVKGISEGTVDIIVTTDIKKITARCTVTVTKAQLKSGAKVTVGKTNYVANKDGSVTFKSAPKASGTLVIPASIKTKINGVTVTAKVTAIAPNAFKGNKKIKSVKMGANVKTIGNNAFMNCTALTTVSMGKGVKTVGNSAFAGCKKLTKLTIGASVTKIGNNAFKGCVALTKVTIPKKVTTIGTQAFGGCKKLALVTIKAENLKKVGAKAFKSIKAGAKFKCGAKAEAYEKLLKKSGLPSKGKVIK